MKISKKIIILLFIFFTFSFEIIANDSQQFNIGYYDLEKDIRYDEWGVHPVDIRSNTNKMFKKPLAGVELGFKDIKPLQRMAKSKFNLITKTIKDIENIEFK